MKYLIDSNIFDKLFLIKGENNEIYQELQVKTQNNSLYLCSTPWQINEIKNIKNDSCRNELLLLIEELKIENVGDVTMYPFYFPAMYSDDEKFELYKGIFQKYGTSNPDARAAVIATIHSATLVTEDGNGKNKGLIQSCKQADPAFKVINFQHFIEETTNK